MKVLSNDKLIKRNRTIGMLTSLAGLGIMVGGFIISIQDINSGQQFGTVLIALILGIILSQIGVYFGNRWGKSPRPDEILTASLKGIGDKYTLMHYVANIPHLLVGPSGLIALLPYQQGGKITYDSVKGRWKQKGGSAYWKIFGEERLGRVDLEVRGEIDDLKKLLAKNGLPELPITAILAFTNPKATVDAADAPYPTVPISKIKEAVRKLQKDITADPEAVRLFLALYK